MGTELKDRFLALVKDGVFGGLEFEGLEGDDCDLGPQFASTLAFVKLILEGSSGRRVLQLVVKRPFAHKDTRISRNSGAMFHNEVAMYGEILPALGVDRNAYPNMFFGVGAGDGSDLLILENLKYKDMVLSKSKTFLDPDQLFVAIRKLAEFHSTSFILKNRSKELFVQLTQKLKEVYTPRTSDSEFEAINFAAMQRGMQPLIEKNIGVEILKELTDLIKSPTKLRNAISAPEEPFSVICHGDYCSNNILYKFDESGKAFECAFFDFQLSMYGSPAIDIFFLLYMHTSSAVRNNHWDEFIKLYWDTLRRNVPQDTEIPSFGDFMKHLSQRAFYGYLICSFFLPIVMAEKPFDYDEIFLEVELSTEEKIAKIVSSGGEVAKRIISEILEHQLEKGYIKSLIEFCKEINFEP